MIRTVQLSEITKNIKEMCIEANHFLSPDMAEAMKQAQQNEKSPLGKQILGQLQENLEIAAQDMIPICQDTGMAVVFLEIGQDVHFEGGSLEEAVNEGVRQGYVEGYLRKSVVGDPLIRENTKDNTPAVLHIRIVEIPSLYKLSIISSSQPRLYFPSSGSSTAQEKIPTDTVLIWAFLKYSMSFFRMSGRSSHCSGL